MSLPNPPRYYEIYTIKRERDLINEIRVINGLFERENLEGIGGTFLVNLTEEQLILKSRAGQGPQGPLGSDSEAAMFEKIKTRILATARNEREEEDGGSARAGGGGGGGAGGGGGRVEQVGFFLLSPCSRRILR